MSLWDIYTLSSAYTDKCTLGIVDIFTDIIVAKEYVHLPPFGNHYTSFKNGSTLYQN
jgi:hypothetical protein